MATIRPGHRPVLLVVDLQVGVMASAWQAERVIANVGRAVDRARAAGVPVLWVQHEAPDLRRDSADWPLVPALVPAAGEPRIEKRHESSFEATPLEPLLAGLGATHVVLAGASTNWCIRATAYAALERGYDLTLLKDAHTTSPLDLGPGGRVEPAALVADFNVVMTWASYPGRRNAAVAVDDLDFAAPPGERESAG